MATCPIIVHLTTYRARRCMTWRVNFVRSKDAQKELARPSLRKLSWEPILDRYCSTEIPILLLTKSWASSLLSTVCGWFVQFNSTTTITSARTTQAQESLFCFQVISNLSNTFRHSNILRYSPAESIFKPLNDGWRESIMTLRFQCGVTCTKGPDREMLTCENTTPHLENKPTVGKPVCEI